MNKSLSSFPDTYQKKKKKKKGKSIDFQHSPDKERSLHLQKRTVREATPEVVQETLRASSCENSTSPSDYFVLVHINSLVFRTFVCAEKIFSAFS